MNRAAYVLASALFAVLVLVKFSPQTGFTSLIRFGETWQDHRHSALRDLPLATVPQSNGYDGQFYAQIALDPLLHSRELTTVIDAPAYRARRILLPATAAVLGIGHPGWTLQAYALLNVLCWFALAWLLYRQIGNRDWTGFARWAGCMFGVGVLDSVRQSLVDLPALLLLVLAAIAHAQARPARSISWLALANLTKETTLLGTLALQIGPEPSEARRWSHPLLGFFLAALPLALWSGYVQLQFHDLPGGSGLGNFSWPFLGALTQARYALREMSFGDFDGRYSFSVLAMLGFATQCWFLWRTPQPNFPWWRIGVAYASLLPFLSFWVWSGYWAACRAVLPLTVAFNLLLPANRWFWPLWIAGNISLLHGVWRFL